MYKNVLTGIPGIEVYPIVALLLFFGFFVGLIVWYVRVDRRRMDEVAQLPLHDGEQTVVSTHQQQS